jgi:hypothetical protein
VTAATPRLARLQALAGTWRMAIGAEPVGETVVTARLLAVLP